MNCAIIHCDQLNINRTVHLLIRQYRWKYFKYFNCLKLQNMLSNHSGIKLEVSTMRIARKLKYIASKKSTSTYSKDQIKMTKEIMHMHISVCYVLHVCMIYRSDNDRIIQYLWKLAKIMLRSKCISLLILGKI